MSINTMTVFKDLFILFGDKNNKKKINVLIIFFTHLKH